jgi:hypothetical protein
MDPIVSSHHSASSSFTYFAIQPQNITDLWRSKIRHIKRPRRAKRGPIIRPRNRQQRPARATVVDSGLCASGVLLIAVQIFFLDGEAPDEFAAAVLAALCCYEFGVCEPAGQELVGIMLQWPERYELVGLLRL